MKTFNIEKFHIIKGDDIDVSFLPMMVRRKLSKLDKIVFSLLENIYQEDVDNIILSSQYGEFDRLNEIISQYTEENMVSPIKFSASVHNYSVAAFSQMKKITNAYNAISAGRDSLSTGIISAIIQDNSKTCMCYADEIGVGLIISTKGNGEYTFFQEDCEAEPIEEFIKFLNKEKNTWKSGLGVFKRL